MCGLNLFVGNFNSNSKFINSIYKKKKFGNGIGFAYQFLFWNWIDPMSVLDWIIHLMNQLIFNATLLKYWPRYIHL